MWPQQSTGLTPLHSLFVATFARMDSGGGLTIDDDWVKFAMALAKQSKAEDVDVGGLLRWFVAGFVAS